MFVYIEHGEQTSVRFQVLSYDKDTQMAMLRGEYGAEFEQNIGKQALLDKGYKLVKSKVELPLASSPPGKTVKPKAKVTTEKE